MLYKHKNLISFYRRVILPICMLAACISAYGREHAYIHYDRANGFPGKTAYGACQDRQGYLWISTENGLARFNGYEFKLYTTKDGLPDNEVFSLYEDKEGRIWFCPWSNAIGYIQNGKVHNTHNDPLLRSLHFRSRPEMVLADRQGNIFIHESEIITRISKDKKIRRYSFGKYFNALGLNISDSGKLQVLYKNAIYQYDDTSFHQVAQLQKSITETEPNLLLHRIFTAAGAKRAFSFCEKLFVSGPLSRNRFENFYRLNMSGMISERIIAICKKDGCFLTDVYTGLATDTLLYGHNVSACTAAANGSLWLTTIDDGMFRLINSPVRSVNQAAISSQISYVRGQKDGMYCVLEKGDFIRTVYDRTGKPVIMENKAPTAIEMYQQCTYLGQNSKNEWVSCSKNIYRYPEKGGSPAEILWTGDTKDVFEDGDTHLVFSCASKIIRIDKNNFTNRDTLYTGRTTCITRSGNTIYAGTLGGLVAGDKPGSFHRIFTGEPSLNTHIARLCTSGDNVWAANNMGDLCIVNQQKILAVINSKNGLNYNNIYVLRASGQFIWAGTDNGLYAIQNKPPFAVVRHLTYVNGLNSNQVSCLDIYNGRIWIGTDKGINYFDEQDVFQNVQKPALIINNITNEHTDIIPGTGRATLSQKALAIDFDVIDYAGGQKPLFQYRLNNDSSWTALENSNLFFPEIPYGDFNVTIQALSPNWKNNTGTQLLFYRPYPFYLRWWFVALAFLVFAGIVTGAVILFIRRVRRKDQEKLSVRRNLLQLEQMALQGQMNPHFIFNCITAIKHYYSSGELQKASRFTDTFALLIRQTFEMGTEAFISLDKELSYLEQYLSVEQARFDGSFDFSVSGDTLLPAADIPIPAMLLQPLAENAVRHGVRHLSNRRGKIDIRVTQKDERVVITITDNGVGREKSRRFGHILQDIGHVTSTTVNTKRIDILNRLFEGQIIHRTEDMTDEQGTVTGTCVTISYPLAIHQLDN